MTPAQSPFGPEPTGATLLDPDERQGLRIKGVETRAELDELEQANVIDGLRWLARQKVASVLDEGFVRRLHKQLFGKVWSWAGSLRLTEKNIGVDPVRIAVELRKLLNDARYWAEHGSYEAREAALRFHHRLVQIHVFPNGNGRHARILTDAYCKRDLKAKPVDWRGGSSLQDDGQHRKAYIAALRAADQGDFAPLLELFAEG